MSEESNEKKTVGTRKKENTKDKVYNNRIDINPTLNEKSFVSFKQFLEQKDDS